MNSQDIYLKDVQSNPQPGPYRDLLETAQKHGFAPWPIWYLFSHQPETTLHLAQFTQGIMHDEAPIAPKLRELIAAYTSYLNRCDFCYKAHAAVAGELYGDHALVETIVRDPEASSISSAEKALLRYVKKITLTLPDCTEADVQELHKHGWSDSAIYFVITACALFNFYNRWITASGVKPQTDENHRALGKNLALKGYDPSRRARGF